MKFLFATLSADRFVSCLLAARMRAIGPFPLVCGFGIVMRMSGTVVKGDQLLATGNGCFLARQLLRGVVVLAVGLFGLSVMASSASAHGGDESQEGYLLVQQGLGYLAHDTSTEGIDLAMEKVDDALAAEDQDGVDVAEVERAKSALDAGQVDQARELLQGSITEALSMLDPATGEQTGTTVVVPELVGRQGLTGRDAAFLAVSVLLLVLGVGLSFHWRPRDDIKALRRQLADSETAPRSAGGLSGTEGDL